MKRNTLFDTLAIFQTTKLRRGRVRFVLMRIFWPNEDPYEAGYNPRVDPTPYYQSGSVGYSVAVFAGEKFKAQIAFGDRP